MDLTVFRLNSSIVQILMIDILCRKSLCFNHRCRSKQSFGVAMDFCPNFPKLARKNFVRLLFLSRTLTKIISHEIIFLECKSPIQTFLISQSH